MSRPTSPAGSDYLSMFADLDERERAIVQRVRDFTNVDVLPVINSYWERAAFPFELVHKLRELEIVGTTIHGYGCPGMSRLASGLVAMEIARADGSLNTFLAVQSGLAMGTISRLGDEKQKQRWLPDMAALNKIGAFALTEPDHGSDSVALETSAERCGDEYVLTGSKRWIGNGTFADVSIVWARDLADQQVKAFIVEKQADGLYPAGYTPVAITGKVGKRAVLQAHIELADVRIPAENLLAQSRGFADVTAILSQTRVNAAWEALGHATAAYEIALAYAGERRQFGRQIAGFQLVQYRLANMLAELSAIQLLCFRVTALLDAGRATAGTASLAKMHAAQKGRWICSEARDILAGNGLLLENHVGRHLTDMEVVHTYEGTDSMQALIVGRDITGISAFA